MDAAADMYTFNGHALRALNERVQGRSRPARHSCTRKTGYLAARAAREPGAVMRVRLGSLLAAGLSLTGTVAVADEASPDRPGIAGKARLRSDLHLLSRTRSMGNQPSRQATGQETMPCSRTGTGPTGADYPRDRSRWSWKHAGDAAHGDFGRGPRCDRGVPGSARALGGGGP